MRPTPLSPPMRFRAVTISSGSVALPSMDTGKPCLKPISTYAGSSGQRRGSLVHAYTSPGGSVHGSSSTPASIERPHKFSSVEYGDCDVAGTSMPCFCAYSISSSRFMPHSLTGATTSRSGASAAVATSNRTWSLPLPVQPCAMAVAPSRRATCTSIAAMRGRPSAVASGYSFSYTAPACSEGQTNSSRNGCLPSATYAARAPEPRCCGSPRRSAPVPARGCRARWSPASPDGRAAKARPRCPAACARCRGSRARGSPAVAGPCRPAGPCSPRQPLHGRVRVLDLVGADDQRRHEADGVVVDSVHKHAGLEAGLLERLGSGLGELHRPHEAAPAHVLSAEVLQSAV